MRTAAFFLVLGLWFSAATAAGAHGMVAGAEPGAWVVRVSFDDGTPIGNALVTVKSLADDQLVIRGYADPEGRFYFQPPGAGLYEVTARDGAGHRYRFELAVGEEGEAPSSTGADVGLVPGFREMFSRVAAGLGYLAGFSALAWWFLKRRAPEDTRPGQTG